MSAVWLYGLFIIPVVGILMVLVARGPLKAWVNVVVTGINLLYFLAGWFGLFRTGHSFAIPLFHLSGFSALVIGITLFVGFTGALYSVHYLELENRQHALHGEHQQRSYPLLILLFYFTLVVAPLWNNVLVTWGFIEATALSSVLLVDFHQDRRSSEAAWKYIILMEIGGILALFGTLMIVSGEPVSMHTATWQGLIQNAKFISPIHLKIGFALVLAGYGTKAGLVPFNAWLPDAHSQAPSPISALLSATKLNVAMYGIVMTMRVLAADDMGRYAHLIMIALGVLTVLVSTLMTISQHDFKRLFAYSSSENLGLIAIGFALGPIGTIGAELQMVNHSLIKSLLFYQSGDLMAAASSTQIQKLRGFALAYPWMGGIFILALLAIAGAPPFGLFISEFTILYAIMHEGAIWLAVLILALLALLFANFLRYALQMGFGLPSDAVEKFKRLYHQMEWRAMVPFGLHLVLVLILGIALPFFLPIIQ